MRAAVVRLAFVALVVAGCGHRAVPTTTSSDARALTAHGMSVELPAGWSGRILLGAEGRPVLHAASFALPPSDDDSGGLAQETIGSRGQMYVNVQEAGDDGSTLPASFAASDFQAPGPEDRCCFVQVARRDVAAAGRSYRVSVTSGSEDPPPKTAVAAVNSLLATLTIEPYVPAKTPPLAADGDEIEGYGITMKLPAGWNGDMSYGRVEAWSRSLRLELREFGAEDASFAARRFPVELSTAEFVAPSGGIDPSIPAMTGGSFAIAGRQFVFTAEAASLPPSRHAIEQASQALASLSARPGDFYPGVVEPAAFAAAAGWHAGAGPPAEREPEGQQTWAWASTTPYLDELPPALPVTTLERLPPDGIVIRVQIYGPGRVDGASAQPPFRIAQAARAYPWEGQIREIPLYSIAGRVPGQAYNVDISVYFGRVRPTKTQIARADAELARLRLPDWSFPGEPRG